MEKLRKPLTALSITGNVLFIVWILFNGINEGFQGTLPEIASYIVLMGLLAVNSMLLFTATKSSR